MDLYFLAIIPSEEICERVHSLKQEIAENYKAKHALKLPAHITLQIPFKLSEAKEKQLIACLQEFAEKQEGFRVDLEDFGRFQQKVIFINILQHEEIKKLHANLQEVLDKNFELEKYEKFPKIHPHITLASRDLHYKEFPKAWAHFKTRDFKASFIVDSFQLLKHDGKRWQAYRDFAFQ